LAKKLHKLAQQHSVLAANHLPDCADEAVSQPFRYLHLGALAYIGNAAVFDLGSQSLMGGLMAMYAWRSVYWSEQVSIRTRALLMVDWIIRWVLYSDLAWQSCAEHYAEASGDGICPSYDNHTPELLYNSMQYIIDPAIQTNRQWRFCPCMTPG
jgi:hypothetical protein